MPQADFRVCRPQFAASDPMETTKMKTEKDTTTPGLAMRPRDAAKALGVSERLLWDWTHHGDIPHLKIGRTILYPVDAVRTWLENKAEAAKGVVDDAR